MYNENYKGIKMDIQTVGIEMNDFLRLKIKNMLIKLIGFMPEVNWIDIYLKNSGKQSVNPRQVRIRFGIPGPDIIASDSGYSWKTMLKKVEKKLIRQLSKRKAIGIK
jgi:ribosome-associated translation inhibitor RaiA